MIWPARPGKAAACLRTGQGSEMADEKVDAWMPLWIGAYLADTMALSRDSHGGYLLLLFAYWRNKGPLAANDEDLAGITKATPAEWKKLRPRLEKFFTVEGGFWSHTRADKELAAAGIRKAAAVSKAKAGADARWKDHNKHQASNAPSMPEALLKQCPTPSPSSLRSEEENPPASRVPPAVAGKRPARKCPEDFFVTAELIAWAALKATGVNLDQETEAFRDWTFRTGKTDWPATWRTWMRGAAKRIPSGALHAKSFRETDLDAKRAEVASWTGGILGQKRPDIIDMEPANGPLRIVD